MNLALINSSIVDSASQFFEAGMLSPIFLMEYGFTIPIISAASSVYPAALTLRVW